MASLTAASVYQQSRAMRTVASKAGVAGRSTGSMTAASSCTPGDTMVVAPPGTGTVGTATSKSGSGKGRGGPLKRWFTVFHKTNSNSSSNKTTSSRSTKQEEAAQLQQEEDGSIKTTKNLSYPRLMNYDPNISNQREANLKLTQDDVSNKENSNYTNQQQEQAQEESLLNAELLNDWLVKLTVQPHGGLCACAGTTHNSHKLTKQRSSSSKLSKAGSANSINSGGSYKSSSHRSLYDNNFDCNNSQATGGKSRAASTKSASKRAAAHQHQEVDAYQNMCILCAQPLRAGDVVSWSPTLACCHVFHHHCLAEQQHHDLKCPACFEPLLPTDDETPCRSKDDSLYCICCEQHGIVRPHSIGAQQGGGILVEEEHILHHSKKNSSGKSSRGGSLLQNYAFRRAGSTKKNRNKHHRNDFVEEEEETEKAQASHISSLWHSHHHHSAPIAPPRGRSWKSRILFEEWRHAQDYQRRGGGRLRRRHSEGNHEKRRRGGDDKDQGGSRRNVVPSEIICLDMPK